MIRFKVKSKSGDKVLLGFGLSEENVTKLKAGDPILFSLEELGIEGTEVLIIYGKTEDDMRKNLDTKGLKEYLK